MPTPTIPACIKAKLLIDTIGLTISNMFYYVGSPMPTTTAELIIVGNALFTHIATPLKALYGSEIKLYGMECSVQTGSGSSIEGNTSVAGVSGTVADQEDDDDSALPDDLPTLDAIIIKKLTGEAGRAKRGRWFFGGISEEVSFRGRVSDNYKNLVLAVCGAGASDVTVAASGTYAGGLFHARHWNRKDNVLMPIQVCKAVYVLGSRRDRRSPRQFNLTLTA